MGRHGVAEVLTGAIVLVVAVAFLAFAVAHSGRTTSSGYTLQARFDHIDGLNVGGDVRIAGVKVGTVTDERIDPKTFTAIVTLTVRDGLDLPKDSAASITSESLLGGKYISLSAGGDETILKPGQMITITQSSVSLEELLGKFIFSATSLTSGKSGQSQSGGQQGGEESQGSSQGGSGGALAPLSK
jgi:phospholipid/cholesterol/gamma-HCH transport system substrate-binding protein